MGIKDTLQNGQEVDRAYKNYIKEQNNNAVKTDALTLIKVTCGSLLTAFNLAVFVDAANLVPGGLSGLSILIQRLALKFLNVEIPFSVLSLLFNAIPAVFAFMILGKKFTLFSFYSIFVYSVATDLIPPIYITDNLLLLAVFGGLIAGAASSTVLNAGASQGGTDLIAMCISARTGRTVFNYMLAVNIVLVAVASVFFGIETALYTVIFYFVTTQTNNYLYRRYEKKTLFIVTERPYDVADEIRRVTNHTCTIFKGEGGFTGKETSMVYVIVGSDELSLVKRHILLIDPGAFINVLKSLNIEGKFYIRPLCD